MFIESLAQQLFKFEADAGAPSGGSASDQNPAGLKGGDTDFVSKSEYDKVLSANNWAQGEVRTMRNQIRELTDKLSNLETDPDNSKTRKVDVEALLAKNAELEKALNTERTQTKQRTIEEKVRRELGDKLAPNTWDYYWSAQKDNFVIAEVEGKEVVQYAPAPYLTFEQILEQLPPAMKASTKASGAGTVANTQAAASGNTVTPTQLQAMSEGDRRKYLVEHPELWQPALNNSKL